MDFIALLGEDGDPYEIEAVTKHGLGTIFPRYAEFWATYVKPNRDPSNPSKLRKNFPTEIEDILNNHYYLFYQLNITFRQINDLAKPDSVLDVGDPFYHLAKATELIQRVFAFALQVKLSLQGEELWHPIDHDVLDKKIKHFLKK